MSKNLIKNLIWLAAIVFVVFIVIYIKLYYPMSQMQLKSSFRHAIATPVEHYYNANELSCGIWYESDSSGKITVGRSNDRVKKCFEQAFKNCDRHNILLVRVNEADANQIVYSLIRIIKPNDQNQCIIQNYYEEDSLDVGQEDNQPLGYINTCTVLSGDYFNSCEPFYMADLRKQMAK